MPSSNGNAAANEVLTALGYALFVRGDDGVLRAHGDVPAWLRALWPSASGPGADLPVTEASPFLENFLIDAAAAWESGGETRANSGPWVETSNAGEVALQGLALTVGGRAMLLIERQGEQFEARKAMLQTARETVIAYQRLNSETQKKDVLLSWIAEQMNAALANVITSLRLIELESNTAPRTRQLLTLASRAADEQQSLINKILGVFRVELEGLYGRAGADDASANLADQLEKVVQAMGTRFAEKRVRLAAPERAPNETLVAMEASHLARVLSGVLETCLENVNAGGEIALEIKQEPDAVMLRICDDGTSLPPDVCEGLFSKSSSGTPESEAASVRLQFCRVALEHCGGEIDYEPREPGGNCFVIRLPLAVAR